jgi:hypothetical protein
MVLLNRMNEYDALGRFIETEGADKGRIKDKDIAWEVALADDAWREEYDGQPLSQPHV